MLFKFLIFRIILTKQLHSNEEIARFCDIPLLTIFFSGNTVLKKDQISLRQQSCWYLCFVFGKFQLISKSIGFIAFFDFLIIFYLILYSTVQVFVTFHCFQKCFGKQCLKTRIMNWCKTIYFSATNAQLSISFFYIPEHLPVNFFKFSFEYPFISISVFKN